MGYYTLTPCVHLNKEIKKTVFIMLHHEQKYKTFYMEPKNKYFNATSNKGPHLSGFYAFASQP